MRKAREVASWSKDPSTKAGAVIVEGTKHFISFGFNGFPPGLRDDDRLFDRKIKYLITLHAEDNAIGFSREVLRRLDCTIYTWPIPPCSRCASKIIREEIKRVVSPPFDLDANERWEEPKGLVTSMFEEAGIEHVLLAKELVENSSS